MSFILRPYQSEAVAAGWRYLTDPALNGRHGLIIAPTGSGKSLLIARIATQLPGPCMVFQPSVEILHQNAAKLATYGYKAAVFSESAGRREIGTITLATIGTAITQVEAFTHLPFILIDEAHVASARSGMYDDFIDAVTEANPAVRVLGFTATPFRLASNMYGSELRFLTRTRPRIFRDVVHHTQIGDLFRQGYLCPLQYRDVPMIGRSRLKLNSTKADYSDASVQTLFGATGFVGHLQQEVERELDAGRRNVLVFTRFVHESEALARALPGCAVVTAKTKPTERAATLAAFKAGELRVVTNVGIIALGFDYPQLECVVLARPSISLGLYYQMVGRVIRPHPGKPIAHVVDMVGLSQQFGRIEDLQLEDRGNGKWVMASQGRALTNENMADLAGFDMGNRFRIRAMLKKRQKKTGPFGPLL